MIVQGADTAVRRYRTHTDRSLPVEGHRTHTTEGKNDMKKTIAVLLSVILALSVCVLPAAAADPAENTAKALYSLDLFLGYGADASGNPRFGLADSLTREQGVLLLLRMLGKQKAAEQSEAEHPFTDVTEYYQPYIAYAYANGLTKGTGATTFSGSQAMTEQMFLTFCMRALGYQDGEGNDFAYAKVVEFAGAHGVTGSAGEGFTRGEVVLIFWQTLAASMKTGGTLADSLIAAGLFTRSAFETAKTIQKTGSVPSASSGGGSSSRSSGGGSSSGSGTETKPEPENPHEDVESEFLPEKTETERDVITGGETGTPTEKPTSGRVVELPEDPA